MARTSSQKALRKAERAGTWSPIMMRRVNEDYGAISQHVRVTPNKRQQLNKVKHKERFFHEDAPFALSGHGLNNR
ncbi:hypothetical protein [Paenibacillus tepidiphilus]|uniref:hypothetical protein n=1 Tax=Paenibacillus tepidiphilus TaxID=2608683 RepID=UPI0012395DB6|nr:hypothetical protein [Paenibacillus tepidiphilus]